MAGTALIGTTEAATVYSRGGARVEMTNSAYVNGVEYFTHDLIAIRAERRLGLPLFRPSAFTEVRLTA